jgi:hypothetical protein
MFKVGDKVQLDQLSNSNYFSHNIPYEIEAILNDGINLVLKGFIGFWGARYFVMYDKKSVGFVIE